MQQSEPTPTYLVHAQDALLLRRHAVVVDAVQQQAAQRVICLHRHHQVPVQAVVGRKEV